MSDTPREYIDKQKRDLEADLKLLTAIPLDPDDPVDTVHDVVAPHALRRAIAAEKSLHSSQEEIANLKWQIAHPVFCWRGICTSQSDDYCGMHMHNESCIACNSIWTQAHVENKERDIAKLKEERDACRKDVLEARELARKEHETAIQAEQERENINGGRDNERFLKNEIIKKYQALEEERNALLEGLKWYADDDTYTLKFIFGGDDFREIMNDCGKRARCIIAKLEGDEKQ